MRVQSLGLAVISKPYMGFGVEGLGLTRTLQLVPNSKVAKVRDGLRPKRLPSPRTFTLNPIPTGSSGTRGHA